jgi:hypothetical protein
VIASLMASRRYFMHSEVIVNQITGSFSKINTKYRERNVSLLPPKNTCRADPLRNRRRKESLSFYKCKISTISRNFKKKLKPAVTRRRSSRDIQNYELIEEAKSTSIASGIAEEL